MKINNNNNKRVSLHNLLRDLIKKSNMWHVALREFYSKNRFNGQMRVFVIFLGDFVGKRHLALPAKSLSYPINISQRWIPKKPEKSSHLPD
jgi:hypothetical protein